MAAKDESGASDCWRLEGTRATLVCGRLRGAIDVERPWRGLGDLRLEDHALEGRLLSVDLGAGLGGGRDETAREQWAPLDVYVRGDDCIVTYREPAGQPFNLQVYWRRVSDGGGERGEPVSLEAIVSVQTPLWEAYPEVVTGSSLRGEVQRRDDVAVVRLATGGSYVEHSPQCDFTLVQSAAAGVGLESTHWQFGPLFMEKGVIRRLRLRGAFADRGDDGAAERLRQSVERERPPLTA